MERDQQSTDHARERLPDNGHRALALVAFLIDQVQEHACPVFKAAREKCRIKTNLWAKIQVYLQDVDAPDWETLVRLIAKLGSKLVIAKSPDTG